MKLNEYGIFEYAKNGHSLGALVLAICHKMMPYEADLTLPLLTVAHEAMTH